VVALLLFHPRTHFAMKMLWPTTPPLDVQLDARLRSGQTISTADVDASRMSGLDLPPDDPSPPAAQAWVVVRVGGRSSRVRPNAGDQELEVYCSFWRSNVAVQPGFLNVVSSAPQAVGRLHVPRQRGFVRRLDDFRRNLIEDENHGALITRLGTAKRASANCQATLASEVIFPELRWRRGSGGSAPLRSMSPAPSQRAL